MKECLKCYVLQDLSCFSINKATKDGLSYYCRTCCNKKAAKWREDNPEMHKQQSLAYYYDNLDRANVRRAIYNKKNAVEIKEKRDKRRRENPEKVKASKKKYSLTHGPEIYQRVINDPQAKLATRLRSRLYDSLKKKTKVGSAVRDAGCSMENLKTHLEHLFQPGMTWDNWGNGAEKWHIDHIMPLSAFDLTDRQHFVLANHYLNLRPMWSTENLRKHNKIPYELAA